MKIGVVGIWHLGEIVAAGLATIGHEVIGIDKDAAVIEKLRAGIPPLSEPGLAETLRHPQIGPRLTWTNDPERLSDCEAIFLTADTPVGDNDTADVRLLFDYVTWMAPHLRPAVVFVVMSQVPVGTTHALVKALTAGRPGLDCTAVYVPENLQLGNALRGFFHPDRLVIGADEARAVVQIERILSPLACARQMMSIVSAEMTKHALNAFLATSLSFIYNIADACEAVGADVTDVSQALRSDPRIGPAAYLDTSLGFSGGTLMRDLTALQSVGQATGKTLPVIEGVLNTNRTRRRRIMERLEQLSGQPLSALHVGMLGLTYKPGTPTLRRSMAMELLSMLRAAGVTVTAYDPLSSPEEYREATGQTLAVDAYEMARGCQAIIMVTAWPEFANLDWLRLKSVMAPPYIFYDTRNFLMDKEPLIRAAGFTYAGVGR